MIEIEDDDWSLAVKQIQQDLKIKSLQDLFTLLQEGQEGVKSVKLDWDAIREYLLVSLKYQEQSPYHKLLQDLLKSKEADVKILEETSKLNKRLRKYKRSDPAETWGSRWVASPLAYLLPQERREEWLGDLYEANSELLHKGYPRWMVNLNNIARTAMLLGSSLSIKLSDLIPLRLGKIK